MTPLTLSSLQQQYAAGTLTPRALIQSLQTRFKKIGDSAIFIHWLTEAELEPYLQKLESVTPDSLPLYGIPFAIKDNIDLAGIPTTAACPDYSYTPESSAFVVQQLIDAGAIPVGKTNLDQFATGLVGVRSPYGVATNPLAPDYIPRWQQFRFGRSSCTVTRGLFAGHRHGRIRTGPSGFQRVDRS